MNVVALWLTENNSVATELTMPLRGFPHKPAERARHFPRAAYRTTSKAQPFKYSVSGIAGMTGWSGDWL